MDIWEDPENDELRQSIKPSTLPRPGDQVFVPEIENKSESAPTDATHGYRRKGPKPNFIECVHLFTLCFWLFNSIHGIT